MKYVPADLSAIFFNQLFRPVLAGYQFKPDEYCPDTIILQRVRQPTLRVRVSTTGSMTLQIEDRVESNALVMFTYGLLNRPYHRVGEYCCWSLSSDLNTYRNLNRIISADYRKGD